MLKSPFNHALVHAVAGIAVGALVIALQEAVTLLSQGGSLDYLTIAKEAALVFLIALGHGLFRYVEAGNDPAYKLAAQVVDQKLSSVEKQVLPNEKTPVPAAQDVLDTKNQVTQVIPAVNPAPVSSDWMKGASNGPVA